MEQTYMIQGADGQQYGPATLAQMKEWITDRRVGPYTQVLRSDQTAWQPAANFTELGLPPAHAVPSPGPAAPPPVPPPAMSPVEQLALEARIKSGAGWFYWIAALSLINSIAAATGSGFGFVVGLGITQIFDVIGKEMGGAGTVLALGMNVMVAAVLVVFGVFANKRHAWAFIVGMVLYGLDGLVFLIGQDWLGVGFHVFVLICITNGFQAMRKHQTLMRTGTAA